MVAGNATKKYTNLSFVGIETTGDNSLDVSGMTHFNFNAWSADFSILKVKLVDFGTDNAFGGGDDVEHELIYNAPEQGEWLTYNIPLSSFTGLTTTGHISQLIFASDNTSTVYLDNVYFSTDDEPVDPSEPMTAAPDPTDDPADVISMFSGVYTDVAVNTWHTDWSSAGYEEVLIQSNPTKKYTNLSFVGIETTGDNSLDVSDMTHFNFNAWSADFSILKVKLVDFGADNAFGGGDDVEHELIYNAPAQGEWLTYNIPLSSFAGLVTKEHVSQLIFASDNTSTVYIDNVYFSTGGDVPVPTEPMTAAPDPTYPEAQVISMFSEAYTNVAVDTWHTDWSQGVLTDVQIQSNPTKKYSGLNFVGIETVGAGGVNEIDATGMDHFNVNIWSPDFTVFKIKLVDFGANGVYDGPGVADDKEHEMVYDAPAQGGWITYHIALSDMTGLTTRANISQLIFATADGTSTVYVDNVYFSTDTAGTEEFSANKLVMYPNPAKDVLNMSGASVIEEVTVFNMLGQQVMKATPNATSAALNVQQLQKGVYIVNAVINGVMTSQKFMKQ
jgi:hypothetical protein